MGERKLSKVLGEKFDNGKLRFSLLPVGVLNKVITVLEIGAKKYQENNWRHVEGAKTRYFDALHRHVDAWWSGERNDPETGQHHLAHAVCCAMFLMWFDLEQPIVPSDVANTVIAGKGERYRHIRTGNTYTVLTYTNCNTGDSDKFPETVVYKSDNNGSVWSRPLTEFLEKFEKISK